MENIPPGHERFDFPRLTIQQIALECREGALGPDATWLTEDHLKKPEVDTIQSVYGIILQFSLSISQEQITQVQFEGTEELEHKDIHEEAIPQSCGAQDFKIKDILDPKPKRTTKFLSAAINFLKFRDQRLQTYESIKEEKVAVQEEYARLQKSNDELRAKINQIRAARAEHEPQVREVQQEVDKLKAVIQEGQRHQETQSSAMAEIEKTIEGRSTKLARLKDDIKSTKEEGDKLRSKIVQSPERMKGEMGRMERSIKTLKVTKEQKGQRLVELHEQQHNNQAMGENCQQGLKLISLIQAECDEQRKANGALMKMRDQVVGQKEVLRDVTTRESQLKRQLGSKQEKLAKFSLQHQNKLSAARETSAVTRKEQEMYQPCMQELERNIMEIEMQKGQLEKQLAEKDENHQGVMDTLTERYKELLNSLDHYHSRIVQVWEKNQPMEED
ncbi:kinetochore-associated Ndc80 complex subunit nuf2 [Branchiostoma belcheri]|nr:kinetochore-associated Ndc80 complex subunit nuf2 [Branchiostoma belcheri]